MIVGAAAAALRGTSIVTQDIDLWFRDLADPGIRKALAKAGGVIVPAIGLYPPTFGGEAVELFAVVLTMHGPGTFDEEKDALATIEKKKAWKTRRALGVKMRANQG